MEQAPGRDTVVKVLFLGDSPPPIVCLLGVAKHQSHILAAYNTQTRLGKVALMPTLQDGENLGLDREQQAKLAALAKQKIQMADEVLVVNPNGRLPDSVQSLVDLAEELGRVVRYLAPTSP